MSYIIHFGLGYILSLIGSLPLGMINMAVADEAINKGFKAGMIIAFGAAVVEFLQAFIALKFTYLFTENPKVDLVIQWGVIPVFIVLGLYYLFKKPNTASSKKNVESVSGFFKGMMLSTLNMLAIPYWVFYGTYLNSEGILVYENVYIIVFALGVMFGGLTLFTAYAKLGLLVVEKMDKARFYTNRFIGILFLGFGVFQLIRLLFFK